VSEPQTVASIEESKRWLRESLDETFAGLEADGKAVLGGDRGKKGKKGQPPADDGAPGSELLAVEDQQRQETIRFLNLVVSQVPYSKVLKLDPRPNVPDFHKVRIVALNDLFLGHTPDDFYTRTGHTPDTVYKTRRHKHYDAVCELLVKAAESLAVDTIEEMTKVMEGSVAAEMAHSAMTEGTTRERLDALREFSARLAPKPGREKGDGKGVLFPPELLDVIERGLRMTHGLQVVDIKGSVVNVPMLEGVADD
jgi:hypothetical protein